MPTNREAGLFAARVNDEWEVVREGESKPSWIWPRGAVPARGGEAVSYFA